MIGRNRRLEVDDDSPRRDERTIEDEAERTLVAVLAQQDDGAVEIGIRQLRHRKEQRGGERVHLPDDNARATLRKSSTNSFVS